MGDLEDLAAALPPPVPPRVWMIHEAGRQHGPYEEAEVISMIADGSVSKTASVWRQGMPAWISIQEMVSPIPAATITGHQAVIPPQPKSVQSPVVGYLSTSATKAIQWNFFAKWKQKSGIRSFIFQIVLIGWTALFVMLGMASFLMAAGNTTPTNPWESQQDAQRASATIAGGSVCCLIGVWALVAIPLAIAAVATFKTAD